MNNLMTPSMGYLIDILDLIVKQNFKGNITGFMGGGRKASKTTSVLKFRLMMLFLKKRVKCYVVRYMVGGAQETFAELLEHIPDGWHESLIINKTNRTITHVNGNELRVMGVNSQDKGGVKKLGNKRGKVADIITIDIDEIFEFPNSKEVQDAVESLGSGEVYWRNDMTNTWSPSHWRLGQALKDHAQNEHLLRTKGEDFKILLRTPNEIKYSHYTNHRINTFLPWNEHQKLLDLHKTDPRRARVADLGLFGVETGGIYSSYMDKVSAPPSQYVPHTFYLGVDVGISRDATTAVLVSVNKQKNQICYHNEYYYSDAEQLYIVDGQTLAYTSKTQDDRARDIIKYVSAWTVQHKISLHQTRLTAYVDYSSSFMEDLNRIARAKRFDNFFKATKCIKPKIKNRIDLFHFLMANRSFFIDQTKVIKLVEELNLSKYDENQPMKPQVPHRLDGRDHSLNAAEYALSFVFRSMLLMPNVQYRK